MTRLPRRDYLLLPLISLATVAVMLVIAESMSRIIWKSAEHDLCRKHDPVVGQRNLAYCSEWMKIPEGTWVNYTFNGCGYRSAASCSTINDNTIRIAVLGSSISEGYGVRYSHTFVGASESRLNKLCTRRVQIQNLGTIGCTPTYASRRVDEALALKPQLLVLPLSPFDVDTDPGLLPTRLNASDPRKGSGASLGLAAELDHLLSSSRAILAARHYLYRDAHLYVRLYLEQGDKTGFLRQPFPPLWQERFSKLNELLGKIALDAHESGVPLMVVALPERAQAVLLNFPPQERPGGIDPYAFGARLARIAAKHGIMFLDLSGDFARIPHAESLFFAADGHLDARGHSVIAGALVKKLTHSRIPAFAGCRGNELDAKGN